LVKTLENNHKGFRVLPFPAARQLVIDAGYLGVQRHIIHGLVEFDVARSREFIREHKAKTGESLSFTAFFVSCLAQAIAANPLVQAHRNWRNQLIVYDDVDVMVTIETKVDAVSLLHVIRAANQKSFREVLECLAHESALAEKVRRHSDCNCCWHVCTWRRMGLWLSSHAHARTDNRRNR
jgi:hypothetical protein